MMDIRSLRLVMAVAEEGSITRAAKRLNYVQSNVTTHLKNLEQELGTTLFRRLPHGMSPTRQGRVLLTYAARILALMEEARNTIIGKGPLRDRLKLGALRSTTSTRLPELLAHLKQSLPDLGVSLTTGSQDQLVQMVLDYQLDGALVFSPVNRPELTELLLFEEELMLAMPKGTRTMKEAAGLASLSPHEGCLFLDRLQRWLVDEGIGRPTVMEVGTTEGVLGCVAASLGISMVPKSMLEVSMHKTLVATLPVPEKYSRVGILFIARTDAGLEGPIWEALSELAGSGRDD